MLSFKQYITESGLGVTPTQLPTMTADDLAKILQSHGYSIKSKTRTTIVILVDGNRIKKMIELSEMLADYGAVIDRSLKGSSIGGLLIGKIRVFIKAAGKTAGLDVEEAAIAELTQAIMNAVAQSGSTIDINLGGRIAHGVAGVKKTPGTPKSDFHLVDESGKPLVHISHKKGKTPKDFQQWGGITEREIVSHPEVKYFQQQVNLLYPGGAIPPGQSAFMKIKSQDLKMMSVYGVKYSTGGVNPNKVDVLLQGDPGLKRISPTQFELTASGHVHYHGEKLTGGYEPVLAVIYKGDRTQLGLKGARASIYPLGGRTFKHEIKNLS